MKPDIQRILFVLVVLSVCLTPPGGLNAAQVLFDPVLNLSEEYTDNIFLTNEDKEDDYISTADLSLNLRALGRTTGMALIINPSYIAFANHDDLNFWRYAGNLRVWNDFERNTRLELTNDYLETEDPRDRSTDYTPATPLQNPVIAADPGRRNRNRYRTNISEARFTRQFGARDNLYAATAYTYHEEVDPPEGELVEDYTDLNPSLGIEYWFAPRWGISLDADYSRRNFEDRDDRQEYTGALRLQRAINQYLNGFVAYQHTVLIYDEGTENNYQIYEPSVGLSYQFEETSRASIGAGYYVQDFDNQGENQEGWNIDSEIYKLWQLGLAYVSLTGASGYEVRDTGAEDLGLNVYYQAGLELGYNFSSRLSTSLFGSYRYDEFPNQEPERIDRTANAGAGIHGQLFRWMETSLTYAYTNVTSDIESQEYTENNIRLTFTLHPPTSYRFNP